MKTAKSNIKVITFDLDDTLWALKPTLDRAEQQAYSWLQQHAPKVCARYSLDQMITARHQHFQRHKNQHHQISVLRHAHYQQLACLSGYDQEQAQAIADQVFAVFLKQRQQVDYFDDTVPMLTTLANRYTLGAITNGNADLSAMSIARYFAFVVSAEDAGCSKPARGIFEMARTQASQHLNASVQAHEIVHVGDGLQFDVLGANQAGFKAVWYNHNATISIATQEQAEHAKLANASVCTLAELAKLDFDAL